MGDWRLGPDDRWVYDPDAPAPDPSATQIRPSTQAALDAIHGASRETPEVPRSDVPRVGDVGDWIDPNAPDPTPDEITDPKHPDYVDPWFGR